jgi:shikimate 5-dehydrogenase
MWIVEPGVPARNLADPVATAAGDGNTVVFCQEGLYGYNTDVQGIVNALREAGAPIAGRW